MVDEIAPVSLHHTLPFMTIVQGDVSGSQSSADTPVVEPVARWDQRRRGSLPLFRQKRDSYALRHEQTELLLAAAGALRSPLPVVDFVRRSISTFYLVDVRAKG
jgi:hypothetical protein